MKKTNCAIYLRVSTEEQTLGFGLTVQEERLRSFVESQGYKLNDEHVYRDEGYSGTLPIEDRPGLKRLFVDAEKKQFEVVLVYRIDRFFRKTRLLLEAVESLFNYGVGFKSITESFDTTTPMGRYMMTNLGAVAEMERETIKERMVGGKIAAFRSGKWIFSTPPYGYKLNKKTRRLEIDKHEAKWVKKFFEWIAHERVSLYEVQRRANNLRIPTKVANNNPRRKTLRFWYKRTIGRIVTSEVYTGVIYYKKYKNSHVGLTDILDPSYLIKEGGGYSQHVPAIVSPELYQTTINQLKQNREFSKRNTKNLYLFSKLLYCSKCGYKFVGTYPRGAREKVYRGWPYQEGHTSPNTRRCLSCGSFPESYLDIPIWDILKKILSNPEYAYEMLRQYTKREANRTQIYERIEEIDTELASVERKRQRATKLYLESEEVDESTYKRLLAEYAHLKKKLENERVQLAQCLLSEEQKREGMEVISGLYQKIKKWLENATPGARYKAYHLMVSRIDLREGDNAANVSFRFPGKEYLDQYVMHLFGDGYQETGHAINYSRSTHGGLSLLQDTYQKCPSPK